MISVIVPAYNAEKWLADCCRSVFDQSLSDWELILVDDGSTDDTLSIAQKLAADRTNVRVIHTENGGVCHARNTGLDAARGEYVTFLDADDLLMPNGLERLYDLLIEQDCDIAIGWKTNMTAEGKDLGCPYARSSALWQGMEPLEHSLQDHPATYSVWGKLYRRSVVADVGVGEGRKVQEPKVAVTEEIVLRYRLSQNSASRGAFSEKLFDILYFAEQKKTLIDQRYPQFGALGKNILVKAHMALLQNLCNTTDSQYRQAEKDSIRAVIRDKAYFIPATGANKKWFFIITHHLYGLYKLLYPLRRR